MKTHLVLRIRLIKLNTSIKVKYMAYGPFSEEEANRLYNIQNKKNTNFNIFYTVIPVVDPPIGEW